MAYYSLFGRVLTKPETKEEFVQFELNRHVDALIIKEYSVRRGSKESFFLNSNLAGKYKVTYGGRDFIGTGVFNVLNNEQNSVLHISTMPSTKSNYQRTGYMVSSKKGYNLVLVNDTNSSFDPVSIVFTEENYLKFKAAFNLLFKNYIPHIYNESSIE